MINTSPKKIAVINATVITLITAVFDILIAIIYDFFKPLPFILTLVVVFVVSFVIINYSLEKFIYQKIKIIYKTIGRLKPGKKEELKKRSKSADVLEMVNQVVLDWNEEKEKEIDELKQMAKYRREFVGNVSHELKTPVFNIQGYILTLLDGGIDDPEINIKFLKKAKKSVNRMIAIVDDLEEINGSNGFYGNESRRIQSRDQYKITLQEYQSLCRQKKNTSGTDQPYRQCDKIR